MNFLAVEFLETALRLEKGIRANKNSSSRVTILHLTSHNVAVVPWRQSNVPKSGHLFLETNGFQFSSFSLPSPSPSLKFPIIMYYYSFKIFPHFWLVKSTHIIHRNQLRMTKFGRMLCLTRKWRQKCSPLQVKAPLTEKTWGRGWVVLVVKKKMTDISLVSRERTTAGTRRNNN